MRRHTDTVDVAGIAFQLSCRYPKPSFWARRHPELITTRPSDVVVRIEYDEEFRRRTRRPAGDTVADAADVRRRDGRLLASTGYYRATVDPRRGRVAVRMAAGFEVSGLMRTLAALWHLERGTLLVRAACFGPAASATLACGLPAAALPSSAAAGWLAVTPRGREVIVRVTPFLEREGRRGRRGWRATTLWLPGAGPNRRVSAATALRTVLPSIWQADRRRVAVERTLDLATRIATSLVCCSVDADIDLAEEALVG